MVDVAGEATADEVVDRENVSDTNQIEAAEAVTSRDDFACKLCDTSFNKIRVLSTHVGRVHKDNIGSPSSQLDGRREKLQVGISCHRTKIVTDHTGYKLSEALVAFY